MKVEIYTDGGSFGNPGPSAYGFVIQSDKKEILYEEGQTIGHATNNIAEYTALIRAFEKVLELAGKKELVVREIAVYADSQLMIQQIRGHYKVKKPHIRDLFDEVYRLIPRLNVPISYTHIPREQNTRADSLVKRALGR